MHFNDDITTTKHWRLPIKNVTEPETISTKAGSYNKLDVKLLKTFFSLSAQTPTLSKHSPHICKNFYAKSKQLKILELIK